MDTIAQGFRAAVHLLLSADREVLDALLLTIRVSGLATVIALALGLPAGFALAEARFPGRRLLVSLVNTGMGLPPVLVGLGVALLLWRSGPLGTLGLMYTPTAMVLAQAVIALPVVVGLTLAAVQQLPPQLRDQALALGASRVQVFALLVREARLPLLAAVMAGLGSVLSEVGAVMMVGGNLRGETRVLTTGILLATRMGQFDSAIALGLVLFVLTFAANWTLTQAQQRAGRRA